MRVIFAQPVNTATVDATDVVLIVGGQAYEVEVETKSETTFILDWSNNTLMDGEATLTVFTSGIQNVEGTAGTMNKSMMWTAKAPYKKGDVNVDGTIDVADIATIITVMASSVGSGSPTTATADVNKDGTVDVADIASVISIMAANSRRLGIANPPPTERTY